MAEANPWLSDPQKRQIGKHNPDNHGNFTIQQALMMAAIQSNPPIRVADNYSREQIEERNEYREFNKQQPIENLKWICDGCGTLNFARPHHSGLIITPRIYHCHNSKCGWDIGGGPSPWLMFYWRNEKNELFRVNPGRGGVDEREYFSVHDPVKFYIM
jgi:hypothetical protein